MIPLVRLGFLAVHRPLKTLFKIVFRLVFAQRRNCDPRGLRTRNPRAKIIASEYVLHCNFTISGSYKEILYN